MASDGAEVAEDYRHALEDLSSNMRFEISNLTVIARENTEYALAIAEVLQEHILKTGPAKKLPALYVLDSIVKNVGTPYTLYFGRNLFKIFMESYAMVDNNVRKKMEDMLRTWKDPVPGSMDTRPVFSHELVRPIENALMKVKGVTMQQQQSRLIGRPNSAMMPHRNTPTPPGMRVPGAQNAYQHAYPTNGTGPGQPYPLPQPQQPGYEQPHHHLNTTPQPQGPYAIQQPPSQSPSPHAGVPSGSVESLSNDIQNLIVAARAEFTQNPHDSSIQARLKGLLDLQGILQRQILPPDQFELIRSKVNELAVTLRPQAPPSIQVSAPTPVSQIQAQIYNPPKPSASSVTPQPLQNQGQTPPPVTLDSLLGQGALAALLGRNPTPQGSSGPQQSDVAFRPPPAAPQPEISRPSSSGAHNPMALLDQLRKAGILGSTPTNAAPTVPPPQPPQQNSTPTPAIPTNIASLLASARQAGLGKSPAQPSNGLDHASLRTSVRPGTINKLYDDLGPPCTQCGRRFRTDEEGKRKKMAHMDWHFRVHQRSTEAEKRGTHRSWYVDAADWLASREIPDSDHISPTYDSERPSSQSTGPSYIPIPDPARGINNVCPICQEKFENKWLDTAQEWVWLDAILVGGRAFHETCHAEAFGDREGTPGQGQQGAARGRTPEAGSVLGKRKAEGLDGKGRSLKSWA